MEINLIEYDSENFREEKLKDLGKLKELDLNDKNLWIDIVALEDKNSLEEIGRIFNIHNLVIEDILEENTRSKYENFNSYVYINISTSNLEIEELKEIEKTNISFIVYDKLLLSFRREDCRELESIKEKLRISEDKRLDYLSYLVYLIIQTVLDKYYLVVEELGIYIDELEDQLLNDPSQEVLHLIYELKRNLILIRKSLWATKNVINSISLNDTVLLDTRSNYYIKSIFNDIIQIIDLVETYREISSGMLDTYLSSIANKTNDVMKILTIVSTIFTPISFYSGLYMMEMKGPKSYLVFIGISSVTLLFMLTYFRKRDWI